MRVYLFPCIEKNIGDDLFIKLLCERYPEINFIISDRAKYGSLHKIPNLYFSKKLRKWLWATSLNPQNSLKKIIALILSALYRMQIPKGDVGISIVGNAFKNMSYTGWNQSRWVRARIKLVKNFYLISTNFGPYYDENWKKDFEKIYPHMTDVCFRDEYSYELFKKLPNVRFAPDAVISLGKQQTENGGNKRVVISLIDCSFVARSKELHRVVGIYETKMIEVAEKFLSNGYKVTFLNSNAEQDRPACNRILSAFHSNDVEVLDYDGNLEPIFDLYKKSTCVVATRLHTIILAWLYNLPVVPIVYDIKVENLLNSYNFNSDRYDIKNLEKISSTDIFNSAQRYNFVLSKKIIEASHLQFMGVDAEFSKLGVKK